MRIFYDVDTQNDFMNESGALYVPHAEIIKGNLRLLTNYARANEIAVLGSVDKHFGTEKYRDREGELARNGGPFQDHCMAGTRGQEKIFETILTWEPKEGPYFGMMIPNRLKEDVTLEQVREEMHPLFRDRAEMVYRWRTGGVWVEGNLTKEQLKKGVYFEKQDYDVFTNPNAEALLEGLGVEEAVVYGVATDVCVRAAVLGMQGRGIQCYVVEDAVKGVFPDKTENALEEMTSEGAKFLRTEEVLKW